MTVAIERDKVIGSWQAEQRLGRRAELAVKPAGVDGSTTVSSLP